MSAGPGRLRRAGAAALGAVALAATGCGGDEPPGLPPTTTAAAPPTSRPATTPAPTASPAPPPTVTVGWSGDAVPASVERGLPADPGRLLRAVTPLLRRPDVMVGNLEGTLTRVADQHQVRAGRR